MYRDTNRGGDRGGRKFGGRPSGGSSRFGSRDGGGRDRGGIVRKMHPATCEECGAPCEVPFRPSGSRPIFCSKHFEGKEPLGPRPSGNRNFSKPKFEDKGSNNTQVMGELKNLNVKMDKLLSALEALIEVNNK